MPKTRDLYDILGVSREASDDELKRAYRKLAMEYHPDRNKSPGAEAKFKEINMAYGVLSDPDKRRAYDRYGEAGLEGQPMPDWGDFPFADLFEGIFGGGFARSPVRQGPQQGAHLKTTLTLKFEEAIFGVEKELEIPRLETCPTCKGSGSEPGTTPLRCPQCRGSGEVRRVSQSLFGQFVSVTTCPRCEGEGEVVSTPCSHCRGQKRVQVVRRIAVKVPAGVDTGTQIRLAGEGEAGVRGGPTGNLYVILEVQPHKHFRRENHDLLLELPINVVQAALGDTVTVPTLDGNEELDIPAGTQPGQVFKIRNKGVPILRRNARGDLLVSIKVVVPEHLTREQKNLLRELGKTLGTVALEPNDKGLLGKMKDAFKA
jgi:molecular chaperone DnaJ